MKKNVFTYVLFALLLICVMVSCNNSKTPEVIAKNPATLKVNYFRQYYAVGDGPEKLVGTLSYTAEGGSSINTIDISSTEVTKTGFDTSVPAEGKVLKLTYKGIDCVVTYNVVKQEAVDIYGKFIVADKTTLDFQDDNKVVKEVWENWDKYYNTSTSKEKKELTYTVGISTSGRTVVNVDGSNYYPDGNGGIHSYPSTDQYFSDDSKYVPNTEYFYVSTSAEDSRSAASGKYLAMAFSYDGTAYIMFVEPSDITNVTKLRDLMVNASIEVTADKMTFGIGGVSMSRVDVENPLGKNLTIMLNRDGYDSTTRAFGLISHSEGEYKGYSYTMKLTDMLIVDP